MREPNNTTVPVILEDSEGLPWGIDRKLDSQADSLANELIGEVYERLLKHSRRTLKYKHGGVKEHWFTIATLKWLKAYVEHELTLHRDELTEDIYPRG